MPVARPAPTKHPLLNRTGLKKLRKERGFTLAELGAYFYLSRDWVSEIEKGRTPYHPGVTQWINDQIARLLELTA
jgi:transcriptional regulator with XRE-family HTH domain